MTARSPRLRALAAVAVPGLALALAAGTAPAQAAPSATPASPTANSASPTANTAGTGTQAAAKYGAGWLARQITANGGYLAPFGAPDAGNTAYAVSALVATGTGRAAVASAVAFLKTQVGDLQDSAGNDIAGALANLVLAATAAGEDPRAFGGTAPENDLVTRLEATIRTTGSDAGLFGAQAPTFDGAFRQGLALAALDAADGSPATVTSGRGWLADQQCANGLWTSYRSDTSRPCEVADPDTFAGPDTNSTGLALQGLAATGGIPFRSKALASLKAVQSTDGGFPYLAAPGLSSDPNSTALSLQGILAARGGPGSPRWSVGGATPFDALQSFQLGCAADAADRGGYETTFAPGAPDVLATVQAVPAQIRASLPVAPRALNRQVRTYPCGGSTASTTRPGVTTEANAATTASPSARMANASAKRAGTRGACSGTSGVTVFVDLTAFGGAKQVRCAPGAPATGVAALQQAGFTPAGTARYGLAFICRINNKPSPAEQPCESTPPADAYWGYFHASQTATTWSYSSAGASTYKPAPGSIEAWAFGDGATPGLTPAKVRAR